MSDSSFPRDDDGGPLFGVYVSSKNASDLDELQFDPLSHEIDNILPPATKRLRISTEQSVDEEESSTSFIWSNHSATDRQTFDCSNQTRQPQLKQVSISKYLKMKKKLKDQKEKLKHLQKSLQLYQPPAPTNLWNQEISDHAKNLMTIFTTKDNNNIEPPSYDMMPSSSFASKQNYSRKSRRQRRLGKCECICFCPVPSQHHDSEPDLDEFIFSSDEEADDDTCIPEPTEFLLQDIPGMSQSLTHSVQIVSVPSSSSPCPSSNSNVSKEDESGSTTDWESPSTSQSQPIS